MSEESDIEMKSALPKKSKKPPASPTTEMLKEPKKMTTKEMVHEALTELKSRKGTSLFAIKKYLELKYNVEVEKVKHIIKKYLKSSVEDGTIVQTRGVGASGSFKLVVSKEKIKKVKKTKKNVEEKKENEKNDKQVKTKAKKAEAKREQKQKKVQIEEKDGKEKVKKAEKTTKAKKTNKMLSTPAKRTAMMKRKSIGSIIKPPKMKPAKRTAKS